LVSHVYCNQGEANLGYQKFELNDQVLYAFCMEPVRNRIPSGLSGAKRLVEELLKLLPVFEVIELGGIVAPAHGAQEYRNASFLKQIVLKSKVPPYSFALVPFRQPNDEEIDKKTDNDPHSEIVYVLVAGTKLRKPRLYACSPQPAGEFIAARRTTLARESAPNRRSWRFPR